MLFHRTFHAVGQGAFYSEELRHDDGERLFRMVYDCGSSTLKDKKMQIKATADLRNDTDVDLLIVSHFHQDHINGIPALNPKRVLIPYLSPDVAIYLMVQAQQDHTEFDLGMALHPEQVFPHAQIIRVIPENAEPPRGEHLTALNIDLSTPPVPAVFNLPSNATISIKPQGFCANIWEYIAYNPNMEKYAKEFRKAINDEHLVWDSLQYGQYFKAHLEEITQAYNPRKKQNRHSLAVYSGPCEILDTHFRRPYLNRPCMSAGFLEYCYHSRNYLYPFAASALYFGDATITRNWLPNFYKEIKEQRLEKVAFIQIPHHGSFYSRGDQIIKLSPHHCLRGRLGIISHGSKNSRHPSSRLINALCDEETPVISVTENPDTVLSISFYIY